MRFFCGKNFWHVLVTLLSLVVLSSACRSHNPVAKECLDIHIEHISLASVYIQRLLIPELLSSDVLPVLCKYMLLDLALKALYGDPVEPVRNMIILNIHGVC
jgi:hypothetical protein